MPKSPQEFILHTRNQLVSKEKMYFFAVAVFRQKEEVTELLVFTRWDFFSYFLQSAFMQKVRWRELPWVILDVVEFLLRKIV